MTQRAFLNVAVKIVRQFREDVFIRPPFEFYVRLI